MGCHVLALGEPFLGESCQGVFLLRVFFRQFCQSFVGIRGQHHRGDIHLTCHGDVMGVLRLAHSTQYSGKGASTFKSDSYGLGIMTLFLAITIRAHRGCFTYTTLFHLHHPGSHIGSHKSSSTIWVSLPFSIINALYVGNTSGTLASRFMYHIVCGIKVSSDHKVRQGFVNANS